MTEVICPQCDHLIGKSNDGSTSNIIWMIKDHIENHCTPEKPYKPYLVTQCCGSKHWSSDEDGYRCIECGEMSMKRKYFLKKNPDFVERPWGGKFTINGVTYGEEEE